MPEANESPISPRFAVQRLTDDGWKTVTFGSSGYGEPEDSPYYGRGLIYHSRYVAEHIAKAYPELTTRVHDISAADDAAAIDGRAA